jgi:hypothetical protein
MIDEIEGKIEDRIKMLGVRIDYQTATNDPGLAYSKEDREFLEWLLDKLPHVGAIY